MPNGQAVSPDRRESINQGGQEEQIENKKFWDEYLEGIEDTPDVPEGEEGPVDQNNDGEPKPGSQAYLLQQANKLKMNKLQINELKPENNEDPSEKNEEAK